MRDLQGIAEINGPRMAQLREERAANVRRATYQGADPDRIQIEHGERVEVRQGISPGTSRKVGRVRGRSTGA